MGRSKSEEWPPETPEEAFNAILDVIDWLDDRRSTIPIDSELVTMREAANRGLVLLAERKAR